LVALSTGVKLCVRAKELLDEAGLEAHEVRPGVLVPVLEGATLADDDETLQERWAALLANAAATPSTIPPSLPYILGQLDPTDARLLDAIFAVGNAPGRNWQEEGIDARAAAIKAEIEGRDFELALDNLFRLRVIYSQATYGSLVAETVLLTTLGSELVRACMPPGDRAEPTRAIIRPSPRRT
jgi:Abortive infection alpha